MKLKQKHILITGASFIGVHLIPRLIQKGVSSIRVVNKSNKHKDHLKKYLADIEFKTADLRNLSRAKTAVKGVDVIFHLAADHGGRGYVNSFQARTAGNLLLDGSVFLAATQTDVEKVIFASSGCVYPNYLQKNTSEKRYLKESDVQVPYDADNMYGWAKLMGELTLNHYHRDFGLQSAIGRFFTVYGEHASESHAVMGSLAKAFVQQDPYEIWGDGTQIRNWTYVADIVEGLVKLSEKIADATAINLGTSERITVDRMVQLALKEAQFAPKKTIHTNMPTGPLNRVADISKAKKLLQWKPQYSFADGLHKTALWYLQNRDKKSVKRNLERLLLES